MIDNYALLCFIGGFLLGLLFMWSLLPFEKHWNLGLKSLLSFEKYWRKWEMRRADGLELRLKQLAERLKEKA